MITAEGSMGSKSKYTTMKSSQNIQKGSNTKKNDASTNFEFESGKGF